MRVFIALELKSAVREKFCSLLNELSSCPAQVKWVEGENLHLTLCFLGEVSPEVVKQLGEKLSQIGREHCGFKLDFSGLGAFPALKRPRVIWCWAKGGEQILKLQKAIEASLIPLGFSPEEKPFSPHLTLGRVKGGKGLEEVLGKVNRQREFSAGQMEISDFALIESKLFSSGPVYTVLERFKLTGGI